MTIADVVIKRLGGAFDVDVTLSESLKYEY